MADDPNARPLWMADAANAIVTGIRGWIDEADREAAFHQAAEAGDFFLLGKVETAIADAYKADPK